MHLTNDLLRAYLDRELAPDALRRAEAHLADCPGCRSELGRVQARADQVRERLAVLAPRPSEQPRPASAALAQLRRKEKTSMLQKLFSQRLRPVWAALTLTATLVVALSFEPVRAWAGQFLGLFRVEQIRVLPVDVTGLGQLNNDETLASRLGQMFAESVTVSREPGEPQVAADAAEASRLAGFEVRGWAGGQPSQIVVQPGTAFEIVIDRRLAQGVLNDAGRSDLQLPRSLDGATIAVDIPSGVTLAYGPCPQYGPGGMKAGGSRVPLSQLRQCSLLAQMPSPSVATPPDVDMAALAEIGLMFTGMTAAEARQFSQTVDWTTTLVVPFPRNAARHESVDVDGVEGYLFTRLSDDGWPAHYTLLWVKDGVIHALTGYDDAATGLAIANALQ